MMPIPYQTEFDADTQARWDEMWAALGAIGELTHREADIVANVVRLGIAWNFAHESAPDGTPWEPLAPRTQAERREGIDSRGIPFRTGAMHPILVRTGDLKRSFTDPDHPRHIFIVTRAPGGVEFTISAADDPATPDRIRTLHAGGHVMGISKGMRDLPAGEPYKGAPVPARPFVGISDQFEDQLYEQARRVLFQRLERV
jgi:hypothetical protein